MKIDSNRWLRGAGIAGLVFSALVAGVAWAADKEAPKAEKRRIVIQEGDGPADVFVWDGDAEAPEAIRVDGGPWLGVTLAGEKDGGGAKVTSVIPDSPADKAGLKKGDVVVALDGDKVVGPATLTEMIHAAEPGKTVRLDVLRDGKKQTLSAELAERKDPFRVLAPGFEGSWVNEEEVRRLAEDARRLAEEHRALELERLPELGRMAFRTGGGPRLGVELVRTTPELREHLGAPEDHGVLVGKVLPGTPAEKAGLKVGDVITSVDGAEVSSAGAILEAIADKGGQGVDIELVRDGKAMKVRAEIPKPAEGEATGPRARRIPVPPVPPVAPVAPVSAI
jgi:predicted metalloprotease with PDZ domain